MRDLTRGREDAVRALRTAQQQLKRFPAAVRETISREKFRGRRPICAGCRIIALPHRSQQIVLQEYIAAVREGMERTARMTDQILQLLPAWRWNPVVEALQALRGVAPLVAVTTIAEIGDLSRFENPRRLMGLPGGLVPSENSSGESIHRGSITKTGNGHVRRALMEAAHAYAFPARVSRHLLKRQEGLPEPIRAIAWKAQVRLCGKFRRLTARGKSGKQGGDRYCP